MQVLSTRTYRFKRSGKEDVVVSPSRLPQVVPDDVAEDPILALAIQDGSITPVELKSETVAEPESAPDPEPTPDRGKSPKSKR